MTIDIHTRTVRDYMLAFKRGADGGYTLSDNAGPVTRAGFEAGAEAFAIARETADELGSVAEDEAEEARVEAEAKAACGRCNDTHVMEAWNESGETWPCTGCPTPCRKCARDEGRGAYCAATPCGCEVTTKVRRKKVDR